MSLAATPSVNRSSPIAATPHFPFSLGCQPPSAMNGLQAPLIPDRSASSTPKPPPLPPARLLQESSSSGPSPFALPSATPLGPSPHGRQPSTASSDDFGDFVASDPLGAASAAVDSPRDDAPADDLLQFSPVRERFLDGAARRVEEKREHLLGPLEALDGVNRPGFSGHDKGFGGEPRPVPGSARRRLSSTSSAGIRYVFPLGRSGSVAHCADALNSTGRS